jgi:hypothetical protein
LLWPAKTAARAERALDVEGLEVVLVAHVQQQVGQLVSATTPATNRCRVIHDLPAFYALAGQVVQALLLILWRGSHADVSHCQRWVRFSVPQQPRKRAAQRGHLNCPAAAGLVQANLILIEDLHKQVGRHPAEELVLALRAIEGDVVPPARAYPAQLFLRQQRAVAASRWTPDGEVPDSRLVRAAAVIKPLDRGCCWAAWDAPVSSLPCTPEPSCRNLPVDRNLPVEGISVANAFVVRDQHLRSHAAGCHGRE